MKKIFNAFIIIASFLAITACSGDANKAETEEKGATISSNIFEMVPADAGCVAVFNATSALNNIGINVSGNSITFPAEIESLVGYNLPQSARAEFAKKFTEITSAIDISQVVAYERDLNFNMIIKVKDNSKLSTALKDMFGDSKSEENFTLYEKKDITIALKDGYAFVTSSRKGVTAISDNLKEASEKSITSVAGISDFIKTSNDATLVLSNDLMASLYTLNGMECPKNFKKDGWGRCSLNFNNLGFKLTASQVDANGSVIKSSDIFSPIDKSMLSHIQSDAIIAAAFTVNQGLIEMFESAMLPYLSSGELEEYEQVQPFLKAINGTIVASVSVNSFNKYDLEDPQNYNAIVKVPMESGKIDELLTLFENSLNEEAASQITKDGDMYSIYKDGVNLKIGKQDDCITILFGNPYSGSSSITNLMTGNYGAAVINANGLSNLTNGYVNSIKQILNINENDVVFEWSIDLAS